MSESKSDDLATFVFNGIDATTGDYLTPPMSARQIASLVTRDPTFSPGQTGSPVTKSHLAELKLRSRLNAAQPMGTRVGVAPESVTTAGWGVIFPQSIDNRIVDALRPLIELRKQQAGKFYKECHGQNGYYSGETKTEFLSRKQVGPGRPDPEIFPYYILLVGSPELIPYQFQYQLDVQYAVGRIWFDSVEEFAIYAQSVVEAEEGKYTVSRKGVFFGPQNLGDKATELSATQLLTPLADRASTRASIHNWEIDRIIGNGATHSRLTELLGGKETPAMLFTASHGMAFPNGDARQLLQQGALLCQDWPGVGSGKIDRSNYFAAEDVSDSARVAGLIAFHFACYGAGTPRLDDFAYQNFAQPKAIAPHSFVSSLPRRLLGHPLGGALAVIGHVERAWGCSIVWQDAGRQISAFEDVVEVLMRGEPVGHALEGINQRYADISTELNADLLDIREGRKPEDDFALAMQWTANNDARSYVIIGDPAVRLPLAEANKPATGRTALTINSRTTMAPVTTLLSNLTSDSATENSASITTRQGSANSQFEPSPQLEMQKAMSSQELSFTIPLKITIGVSVGDKTEKLATPRKSSSEFEEFAVTIDPDYESREGYDCKFLGTGRFVPLPQLTTQQLSDAAKFLSDSGREMVELKYHHYSVVQNGVRKLAFFTAVNIDGTLADRPTREPDKWHFDPRIPQSMQAGEDVYKSNPIDRGHLVRRLDPAWGRTQAIIKRANDDTFHFTNCSPQHERFNQGKNLWAGLEDYLLDKATDEDRRMTVFTGPVFTDFDPVYRGIPIPKKFWKVAVVARPNRKIAALGFIVDQSKLLKKVVSFDPSDVAETFQVAISDIEQMTGLKFGSLTLSDVGSVGSFAVGDSSQRLLTSMEDIVMAKAEAVSVDAFSPTPSGRPVPPETIAGTDLRYYMVAYDENGNERLDHPSGQISRLVSDAVADPSVTDVVIMSHGWQGDVPGARRQFSSWIGSMASAQADRQRIRQLRPNFNPVFVGIHWPSQPWGNEQLGTTSFATAGAGQTGPSTAKELEEYSMRLGDSPEARENVRPVLRKVLDLVNHSAHDVGGQLTAELAAAYRELDAAIGLGAQGVSGSPGNDRDPFDPAFVAQEYKQAFPNGENPDNTVAFGSADLSLRDRLLVPLRVLSYWKMKDRARMIGENSVHQLLVSLQETASGRDVRFHMMGHSFGCIVATGAVTGLSHSSVLPQPIDSLILLQGALSLWAYCPDIPYAQGTAGYFHPLVAQRRVRGPIVTTRSKHDSAVGTWYPLASRVSQSVAFDAPTSLPKYGGIGSFGIQGEGLQINKWDLGDDDTEYQLGGSGAITNVDASRVIKGHSDISHSEVAHLIWAAIRG